MPVTRTFTVPQSTLDVLTDEIQNNSRLDSVAADLVSALDLPLLRCESCEDFVNIDDAIPVDDGEIQVCRNCVDNYYYWESDDSYHTEEEEYDDDDSDDGNIPGYHSQRVAMPEPIPLDGLGVELETYQNNIPEAAEFFHELRKRWKNQFKFERDGSLDSRHGVELAACPYTLSQLNDPEGSPWHEALSWSSKNGGRAWKAGSGYGMHISLNGAGMSRLHRAKIVRFINDNRALCEKLAGRTESSWGVFNHKGRPLSSSHQETDKYVAAANRGDRIEVRIFRASLLWERFIRNCEFCDAVRVYCKTASATDSGLSEKEFLEWLSKAGSQKSWPALKRFLFPKKQKTDAPAPVVVEEV